MTDENNLSKDTIHPCGARLRRVEKAVFLLAVIVVLLDVFLWRAG